MKALATLVGLTVLGQAAPAAAQAPLQLEEAIRLALTRNERAAIAELDITVADAGVSKARVGFLPVLSVNANNTLKPFDSPIDTAQGAITFSQPLINAPAFATLSQAKHNLQGQRAQSLDDKRQLAFDAAQTFMGVLLAEQVVQAAQKKLDTAKANLADTEAQVRAQLVSSNDVTRAQISVASAVREVATDKGNLEVAMTELAFVLNTPIAGGLGRPDTLLAAGQQQPTTADQLISTSLVRRPDLIARKESALAAHDFAREPRLRFLPSLALTAQASLTTNGGNSDRYYDAQLAVTANWTIFDAGSRSADARSRDAQAAIADLEVIRLARTADQEIRSAAAKLASAQQALAAARDAMEAARKSASETAILYRQGLAKAIELIDANDQRFVAEVGFASTEFAVANAYLTLRQAMGFAPIGDAR